MWRVAWIILGGLLVVVLGVTVVLRDTSTPIDVENAEGSFQGVVGDAPGQPGVYAYLTVGHEEIDALAGARHDYPEVTYIIITAEACGPSARWQPLQERSIEWRHCGPDLAVTDTV